MRTVSVTLLKLLWAGYLVLTSLYCLLTFLPYTYAALIKAPAYEWMPWFVHHHVVLYWVLLLGLVIAGWPQRKQGRSLVILAAPAAIGVFLLFRPVLAGLVSDQWALFWGIAFLTPLILVSASDLWECVRTVPRHDLSRPLFGYSSAALSAVIVSLLYSAGTQQRAWGEGATLHLPAKNFQLALWSVFTHLLVAVLIVSVLNLVSLIAARTPRPRPVRWLLIAILSVAGVWVSLSLFLANALSFEGWLAQLYAGTLAVALISAVFWIVLPWTLRPAPPPSFVRPFALGALALVFAAVAVALPSWIAGSDWNGILQNTFTLLFWIVLSVCLYQLRPAPGRSFNLATILAVLLVAVFTYKGLQFSAIFWSRPLGQTDDEIALALEDYAARDASFQLAHHVLGNARHEKCADLCRIMREYTGIRDARVKFEVNLNDSLQPATDRPNIFVFVIDSLRPDYLGAYNPKVDFTPNLDAFARDSIAIRNTFTQYAGTTLSEPAIWSGTMLLHSHYMQPFPRVNNLEKMARADNYQLFISYDTVLRELLSSSDDMVKLDTDKTLWSRFEVCSTVEQAEQALDHRRDPSRPVLFYAQPMNVHQFARNELPGPRQTGWRERPGFNNRVAYEVHQVDECLGRFFTFLKARGLYDSSIIVLTSDHGDATGELGRLSHSVAIYPEIMRVPMVVHLPSKLRARVTHDDRRITLLTDITPSIYYLLGHRPVQANPMFGIPMFVEDPAEWSAYPRDEIFLASDVRAAYGILAENGRFLYVTYDSPAQSHLWDLHSDPDALNDILTPALKKKYDERVIGHLHQVADFYGYKPGLGSLLASKR